MAAACAALMGCRPVDPTDSSRADNVGLFTPGFTIATSVGAVSAADSGPPDAGPSLCMGTDIPALPDDAGVGKPADCLTIDFTTVEPMVGSYDTPTTQPNNGAVWIENDQGQYATGLQHWYMKWLAQSAPYFLFTKKRVGCDDPDLVTMATLPTHQAHHLVWKCDDTKGQIVPDGNYVLWIEMQIDEKHPQQPVSFPFTKGPTPWTMNFPATPITTAVTVSYTPIK